MEGALDSQIVAATVRKLAKLSSEAKESESLKIVETSYAIVQR